jgi:ectoine hydroxylase
MTDVYESRTRAQPEMAERCDPVLWSTTAQGPLGREQLDHYARYGFLVLPKLFTAAEVATLLAEMERLAAAADRSRDDVIVEPESNAVRSLFRLHHDSEVIRRLAAEPRLASAARQILGSDVYIHQSRVNFKPAFEGKAFQWHSDFETWHVEDGMPRMRALSVSLLLTRNTEHNGPLLVLPGSHARYVRCVGETPPDHFKQSLRKQSYGVPDRDSLTRLASDHEIVSCTGDAGTVVMFDCNLMHGSSANITPLPRHNVFLCYNSVENQLVEPFGGTPARPLFLAEREIAVVG